MTLDELYNIILDRQKNPQKESYTASLFKEGKDRIIQKVGEESTEVVIAAKNEDKTQIIYEVADLWFHILILLAEMKITPQEILNELEKRHKKAV
jgi:phosphoribosyl-ATP pyrophosphohydrolase/phosphoribosyl-AMP cyclohydrolase